VTFLMMFRRRSAWLALIAFVLVTAALGEAGPVLAQGTAPSSGATAARVPPSDQADLAAQADVLEHQAEKLYHSGEAAGALTAWRKALRIRLTLNNLVFQEHDLGNIGAAYEALGQYAKALDCAQQSLKAARALGDGLGEEHKLATIGSVYTDMGQYAKALDFYKQSLTVARAISDGLGEEHALGNIGTVYFNLSQYVKALDFDHQMLAKADKIGDDEGEWTELGNIANVYQTVGEYSSALDFYQDALPKIRATGDLHAEESVLGNIGSAYSELGQYAEALDFDQQSLKAADAIGDKQGEDAELNDEGTVCICLGQYDRAMTVLQQALTQGREIGDTLDEEIALTNIAVIYTNLGQYANALDYDQQALATARAIGDKHSEANALGNIGAAYLGLGQFDKVLKFSEDAIGVDQAIGNQKGEELSLGNIGTVYCSRGQYANALDWYQRALMKARVIGRSEDEALWLNNLMRLLHTAKQDAFAVFSGKEAIDVYQTIRADVLQLDPSTQKSYTQTVAKTYRGLADILISLHRYSEAQQVIRLLKEQEFFDYIRRDQDQAVPPPSVQPVARTAAETAWAHTYEDAATSVTDAVYQAARARAEAGFAKALSTIAARASAVDPRQGLDTGENVAVSLKPGQAALYTIVEPDRVICLIWTAGKTEPVPVSILVSSDDLYAKILSFRRILQDPTRDPEPTARQLYTLLFAPIEKALATGSGGEPVTNIALSLDDALRYIPFGALHDGKQYLALRYRFRILTPAAAATQAASAPPSASLPQRPALGAGVSEAQPPFPALPGVKTELADVIQEPGETTGVAPGERLLDGGFTQATLLQSLSTHPWLVHLASHFALTGTDTGSYLLLGDGSDLSVADMAKLGGSPGSQPLLAGVDLLTLSACETGMEIRSSNGAEIEGFGALAQQLGARSVVASLWPVSDAATPAFMDAFYRALQQPGVDRSEALRVAQIAMLTGKGVGQVLTEQGDVRRGAPTDPESPETPLRSSSFVVKTDASGPPYVRDPKAPYAHPFYWAPFVLMGSGN
jgi:CHAT domain-containing protein/Tfp pilus assembly protein PilF